METDVLEIFDGTPKYFVISDFDLITYPPSTLTISQRIEFPREEINPDDAVAALEKYLK